MKRRQAITLLVTTLFRDHFDLLRQTVLCLAEGVDETVLKLTLTASKFHHKRLVNILVESSMSTEDAVMLQGAIPAILRLGVMMGNKQFADQYIGQFKQPVEELLSDLATEYQKQQQR